MAAGPGGESVGSVLQDRGPPVLALPSLGAGAAHALHSERVGRIVNTVETQKVRLALQVGEVKM